MKHRDYFIEDVREKIKALKHDQKPAFGLMSPQHMIEHLIWVTKASVKEMGPIPEELTKGQLGFMKFVDNGAEFKYRPSDKSEADLPPLKFDNLEDALTEFPNAIQRMIYAIDNLPEGSAFYNPMMGKLTGDQMALFHRQHFAWHLEKQFGL